MNARSRSRWGERLQRTDAELDALCKAFFDALVVPPDWRMMKWDIARQHNGDILSVGKVFRDMRTKGLELMHYRVAFLTYSENGLICEKQMIDFGKYKYLTVISNKKIEQINEFIAEKYTSPPATSPREDGKREESPAVDPNDGLQHFRDRFGN